jgi:hypothetical protein
MIDLINNVKNMPVDEVNILIQKYAPLLELVKQREQIPYLAYIFDIGIKYVREKYNNLDTNWQQWSIVCLKEFQIKEQIKSETDIYKIIDDFVEYTKINYQEYYNNIGMFVDEYYRDCGFVHAFTHKNR